MDHTRAVSTLPLNHTREFNALPLNHPLLPLSQMGSWACWTVGLTQRGTAYVHMYPCARSQGRATRDTEEHERLGAPKGADPSVTCAE